MAYLDNKVKERLMDCLTCNGIEVFSDSLGYDSLAFVAAIVDIENEFGIAFPDEFLTFESFSSFETLLDIVILQISMNETNGHQA